MKILIATATAGGGHLQAAAALEEAWRSWRPRDVVHRVDTLDYTPRLYRKAYADGYVKLVDHSPELYAHAFRKTDTLRFIQKIAKVRGFAARWVARPFLKYVDQFKPDLVLCPHFLPMEALSSAAGTSRRRRPRIITVVTDFEAHALWMEASVDLYAVAAESTKARLVARGVPPNRVIVTGIPVSKRFRNRRGHAGMWKKYRVGKKPPIVLVLAGGLGMGPVSETLASVDRAAIPLQIIVVTGRNEALRQRLSKKRYKHTVRVLGFADHMEELMAMADLILTKPGGLTTSEALAMGKPLLIINPLPGQEAANSDFLLEHGAAAKVNRIEDLPYRLKSLLGTSRLKKMAQASKRLGKPDAALAICKAALKMTRSVLLLMAMSSLAHAIETEPPAEDAMKSVLQYREGLKKVVEFADSRPDLIPASPLKEARLMTRAQKEELWSTWNSFLDYILALDSFQAARKDVPLTSDAKRRDQFLVRYGAFAAEYRWTLELLHRLDNDPTFRAILNEPVPEIGLPRGTYDRLRFRFLNALPASHFVSMRVIDRAKSDQSPSDLRSAIQEDENAIWKMGYGRGEALTLKNAVHVVRTGSFNLWFPVQAGVSEWMGDTKVWRRNQALIQESQIHELRTKLLPGDILIERREWYLSNVGLPGFWPHAALYIGSADERRRYFGKKFEASLEKQYPKAYADSLVAYEGHSPTVLEAISEGVAFTSLEHSAAADSLVVFRPRNTAAEKAIAITRAFHYAGRPYDFNFDFATDSTLVCSELVYKAYEPSKDYKGVRFDWETMLGRQVASPNRMVQQFDAEFEKPEQQMDLVLFLDGYEKSGKAYPASVDELRSSWHRPKWHIWAQKAPTP